MIRIGIIGGGASGMMAAITAGEHIRQLHLEKQVQVTLLEAEAFPGKKILSTGNGRCNFSNRDFSTDKYHTASPDIAEAVFSCFGVQDLCSFLERIGMRIKEREGYLYPSTDSAATVRDLLERALYRLPVTVHTDTMVSDISIDEGGQFTVTCADHKTCSFDRLILSCGTKAGLSPKQMRERENSFDLAELAKKLGLSFSAFVPGLVRLPMEDPFFKKTHGIRIDGEVSLFAEDRLLGREKGEIQLTEKALSGIPVFQHSALALQALKEGKQVTAHVNLLPDLSADALWEDISRRLSAYPEDTVSGALLGLLPGKVLEALLYRLGCKSSVKAGDFTGEITHLVNAIRDLTFPVEIMPELASGQVCHGGLSLNAFTNNLEAKALPGFYATGEALSIDGICGGYNLQWAFSSGYVAGNHILQEFYDPDQ
ncbi:MAG: aminoacetone oxidase family FAD-binding enzyme [Lachnospiraceae bacterium]|nr:aminoacetone oxidase family FAD-binding enzyme [Lachnospiraceae bacterium]